MSAAFRHPLMAFPDPHQPTLVPNPGRRIWEEMSTLSTLEVLGLSLHPHQQQLPALLWLFGAEMMAEDSERINWIFSRLAAFSLGEIL